jgi:hypothetical protein
MQLQSFDIGKWHGKLLLTPASFETLANLAEHPEAAAEFKRSIRVFSSTLKGEPSATSAEDLNLTERLRNHAYKDALYAIEHYSALMVVTATTYVENMLFEFLTALFIARPTAMHQYLMGDDSRRGTAVVPLQEILDANDLSEVRSALAARSAKNANTGSVAKVISRIELITKRGFAKTISNPIVEIFHLRNQIVHDGRQPTMEVADVKTRYGFVEHFLAELGRQCQCLAIPYSDPGFLIDEPPLSMEPPDGYPLERSS